MSNKSKVGRGPLRFDPPPMLGTLLGHLVIALSAGLVAAALLLMVDGFRVRTSQVMLESGYYARLWQGVIVYVLIACIAELIRRRKDRS